MIAVVNIQKKRSETNVKNLLYLEVILNALKKSYMYPIIRPHTMHIITDMLPPHYLNMLLKNPLVFSCFSPG